MQGQRKRSSIPSAGRSAAGGAIVPTCFERALVQRPIAVMAACMVCCVVLIFFTTVAGFPAFSGGGFNARSTPTQTRVDALEVLTLEADQNGDSQRRVSAPLQKIQATRVSYGSLRALQTPTTSAITDAWPPPAPVWTTFIVAVGCAIIWPRAIRKGQAGQTTPGAGLALRRVCTDR